MDTPRSPRTRHRRRRLLLMSVGGVGAGLTAGLVGDWAYAPAVGWTVAALAYNVSVWSRIARLDAERTAAHATQEDPGTATSDLLILLAALGSLAAVVLVMLAGAQAEGGQRFLLAGLALVCTAMSWTLVHTLFTLRYTDLYYSGTPGGIDFNQAEPPQYTDIAYMAFSVGMTYQVSDTSITSRPMRSAALRHSLLAFVFGTGILATTINLVVALIN